MKQLFMVLAAVIFLSSGARAATVDYGWEDGGGILGNYGEISGSTDRTIFHSGSASLKLKDNSDSGVPFAYVGWINGLNDGDEVTAGLWFYGPGRLSGSYTGDDTDIDSYAGSAGATGLSDGTGWNHLSYTWTFDSRGGTRTGLVIEARIYPGTSADSGLINTLTVTALDGGAADSGWIDSLAITVPDDATIALPQSGGSAVPVPGAVCLLASGILGLAGMGRSGRLAA